ncbi:unnamed protein product [Cyprideis torosa]|uniref:Uncharacterized protein n=1 Tax=Cyprideis torosa TaxID=163714 RepID=A0A7R8WBB2_9CRUS|nr:unnamed protein product [Cyprideis torosa]CAG0886119.1 unnamed protein product [Cyprideis torosa]
MHCPLPVKARIPSSITGCPKITVEVEVDSIAKATAGLGLLGAAKVTEDNEPTLGKHPSVTDLSYLHSKCWNSTCIFLIESSGRNYILPRYQCAIEAAAHHHPHRPIILLTSAYQDREQRLLQVIQKAFPNIHVVPANFEDFIPGTQLQDQDVREKSELIAGMTFRNETEYKISPMYVQHVVLFSCGTVRSAFVLLCFYKKKIPIELEFLATGMTMYLLIPMFLFHLPAHANTPIFKMIHIVIVILCYLIGTITFYEMKHRNSVMASLGKCYFTALLGVWMAHAGDVLMYVNPFRANLLMTKENLQLFYVSMYLILDALIVATVFVVLVARLGKSTKGCVKKAGGAND